MDGIKQFLSNHFEKLALLAALVIVLVALAGVFVGGTVADLRTTIEGLIGVVEINIQNAEVDPAYDPEKVDIYDQKVLSAFSTVEDMALTLDIPWYPPGIKMLPPIVRELPIAAPYEETFQIENGPVDSVSIDDPGIGTVKLSDDRRSFVLTRSADLDEPGTSVIRISKGKEYFVHQVIISVREIYVPRPVTDIKGYAKPGRNFVIWATDPEDLARATGFNVYRKETKAGQFDMTKPINTELIDPLGYVPEEGEDEPGSVEIVDDEEVQGEAPDGEDSAPAAEGEEGAEAEPEENSEPFDLSTASPYGTGKFSLPDPAGARRAQNAGGNRGGMFVDRTITPLQTYWYAVETVSRKTQEELAKEIEDGRANPELFVRSALSEIVQVEASDVTKMYFRSLVGSVKTPDDKKMAMAVIEVKRFEKVAWISGTFNVRIGERIGALKKVDYPKINDKDDSIEWIKKSVDFKTSYTLRDILEVKEIKIQILRKPKIDKDTGLQAIDEDGEPVFIEEEIEMPFTTYKVIVTNDNGDEEEYPMQKPRTEEPLRVIRRTPAGSRDVTNRPSNAHPASSYPGRGPYMPPPR